MFSTALEYLLAGNYWHIIEARSAKGCQTSLRTSAATLNDIQG